MKTEKYCGIASIVSRKELLLKTVESLYKQFDKLYITLNNYEVIPDELKDDKIECIIHDNSVGAAMKFIGTQECNGYYFTADDDLIYPIDYARRLIDTLKIYDNKFIVTAHGGKIRQYPLDTAKRILNPKYRFFDHVGEDHFIQWGGTGCMAFHQPTIKINMDMFVHRNLVDLDVYRYTQSNKIPVLVVKHPRDWITYQEEAMNTINLYKFNARSSIKQRTIVAAVNDMKKPKTYFR